MRTSKSFLAALAASLLIGAGAAPVVQAADAPDESDDAPKFVGKPQVVFGKSPGSSVAVTVRFDRAIPKGTDGTFMVVGPKIKTGDRIESRDMRGAETAGSVGVQSRHCYLLGAARLRGDRRPRNGDRWRLGLLLPDDDRRVSVTAKVTMRSSRKSDPNPAKRLGCLKGKRSRSTQQAPLLADAQDTPPVAVDSWSQTGAVPPRAEAQLRGSKKNRLVGKTLRVKTKEALVYEGPGVGYSGVLMRGQRFKIENLSPSGKLAFGRAFGKVNRDAYIFVNKLRVP